MTDTPTPDPTASKSSSSTRTIVIAVIAVIVLAGGGFAAYKLTQSEETGAGPFKIAHEVRDAIADANTATIAKLSTSDGKVALLKIKPNEVKGLVWGGCTQTFGAKSASKTCKWTRPGGELVFILTAPDKKWIVDAVTVGPAGLQNTTTTT